MSAYRAAAYHPGEGVIRVASWLDDYFGRHQYGVRFDEGGPVFEPSEVEIPLDVIFAPADFDSTRLRAQLDEARGALEEIAKQHLPEEIIDDDDPDYELGYDMAIRRARAFLEKTEEE